MDNTFVAPRGGVYQITYTIGETTYINNIYANVGDILFLDDFLPFSSYPTKRERKLLKTKLGRLLLGEKRVKELELHETEIKIQRKRNGI